MAPGIWSASLLIRTSNEHCAPVNDNFLQTAREFRHGWENDSAGSGSKHL
jgi:hypothetical protein